MKNRIAKLLRALADKLSPEKPTVYLTPIKTDSVEFKRFCVGHALPKGQLFQTLLRRGLMLHTPT